MTTTGYADTFNRTVSGGFGTATSGQTYQIASPGGVTAPFSVSGGVASIAMNATGSAWYGVVDRQTSDIDITAQVAVSTIPATNLTVVGLIGKMSSNFLNYYIGQMRIGTSGTVSIRLSKVLAGSLITLQDTLLSGVTYTAGAYYNLRFQCYWSQTLQTNVLNAKLWPVNTAEPGGWMATYQDNSVSQYVAGTMAGPYSRDEQTTPGNTARWQNVLTRSYNLPMPAATDTMCADPSVAYPKQTALQSMAAAVDAQMAILDPLTSIANAFPRVRVSGTNFVADLTSGFYTFSWAATEFNVGTPTNLGYNSQQIQLPVGIWLLTGEVMLAEAASNAFLLELGGWTAVGSPVADMRSNPAQLNDQSQGGSGHISALTYCTDPLAPITCQLSMIPTNNARYAVKYAALSAIKISDYFT